MSTEEGRLSDQRCAPCEGGVRPYSAAEAERELAELDPAWRLDASGHGIGRELRFKNFYQVMSFVNAVAHLANREDHHPDLEIGYNYCRIRWTTHAIQGLSRNDFICAAKVDRLAG